MKKVLLGLLLVFCAGCAPRLPERPESLAGGAVQFRQPEFIEWKEPSGMTVLFLPNKELPLVEGELFFPVGSLHEQPAEFGRTALLFSQMREGGVRGLSPKELDRKLDGMAATIEGAAGSEYSSFSFFSHRDDFPETLTLFRRILTEPQFDGERLTLAKTQLLDSIKRRGESAETIAGMTFAKAFYANDSIYSQSISPAQVRALSTQTLRKAFHELVRPEGTILVVTGCISEAELRQVLQTEFGTWRGASTPRDVPAPKLRKKPGIYVVESRFEQAAVVLGGPAPARLSPDHFKLSVFNRYFSSGAFGSVLFSEIRSKRGLAYSVSGGFSPAAKGGEFVIGLGTRVSESLYALEELLRQIERAKSETATPERLEEIKRAVERSFIFNFASPGAVLDREAALRLLHFPTDFNRTYVDRIREVSREDLLSVANRFLEESGFHIVIVGKVSAKEIKARVGNRFPVYRVSFDTEPKIGQEVR